MKKLLLPALLLPLALLAQNRVAVWDPEVNTEHQRFSVQRGEFLKIAETLNAHNLPAELLTTAQLRDPVAFNAARHAALVLCGGAFPADNLAAYERFTADGGIMVEAGARIPFLIQISRDANGAWQPEPQTPAFAWQSNKILRDLFGLSYNYDTAMHDLGYIHTATPLLKRFQPAAPDIPNRRLETRWLVPRDTTQIFPLLRSLRPDNLDTTPQIFVVRDATRTAVVSTHKRYTLGTEPGLWPDAPATLVAMLKLCHELRANPNLLTPDMAVEVVKETTGFGPLQNFPLGKSVDPEGYPHLLRFGEFNGSLLELDPPLEANQTINANNKPFPRLLNDNSGVWFDTPFSEKPRFLRVRMAIEKIGQIHAVQLVSRQDDIIVCVLFTEVV